MVDLSPPGWGIISWLLLILATLTFCDKILGYSVEYLIRTIFREARDLASLNITRGSINFLGLVILFTFSVLIMFSESAASLFNVEEITSSTEKESDVWIGPGLFFFLFLKSVVCVALVKPKP